MIIKTKKGAIELSISTIVIVVLAMSMLILGLVLIKDIFEGTKYNVKELNKQVEAEINKLFNEKGDKVVIYLPDKNTIEIAQGKSFGVAFGVRNTAEGETAPGKFSYKVEASDIQTGCKLTLAQANEYIILGAKGSFDLSPGKSHSDSFKIQPPESAPLCQVKYYLSVVKDNQPYDTIPFTVQIK